MYFLLAIALLLIVTKGLGEIVERLGLPSILGEILGGMLLGVSFLNLINPSQVETLAILGVILLLFLVGFNFSMEKMKKEGKAGVFMCLLGYFFILIPMYYLFSKIGLGFVHAMLFSIVMAGESTANVIKALSDLKKIHSRVAEIIISATVVEDFILYTLLAVGVVLVRSKGSIDVVLGFSRVVIFFLTFLIMERITPIIIKYSEKLRCEEAQFATAFILIILLAYFANALGFAAIIGAFFAGIALSYSPYLRVGSFSPKIATFTYGVLAPLFFGWIGAQISLKTITLGLSMFLVILIGVCGKFVGNLIGAYLSGATFKESLGAAIGLINLAGDQLLVLVIISQLGIFGKIINTVLFPATVLTMVLSIFFGPMLLKLFFKKLY